MSKRKEKILSELGFTYAGLSGKTQKDFGRGKPFIPFMNIMSNGKIDPKFMGLVDVAPNERQNAVQKGDLFFTTSSETPEEVGMTSVLLEDVGECYLNSFCFGFRLYNFDDLLPEFAPYLFRGCEVRKQIINLGQGYTRFNLPKTELLKKLKLSLPSESEQKQISEILTKADSIIEKTQAAIAKYKAIKQGMLQDLFTRGIDLNTNKLRPRYEDAPELYKESKLGWIPREWEEEYIDSIGEVITGSTPPTARVDYYGDQFLFVSPADIQDNHYINETGKKLTKSGFDVCRKLPAESICVVCIGSTIGKMALLAVEGCTNQQINSVICFDPELSTYFFYAMMFYNEPQFRRETGLQAVPIVNKRQFSEFLVPVAKKTEALQIAERLKSIDNKLQTEQTYLQKMQSLKKGLMEDLLSGRKQVKVNEELVSQNEH
jgi:type I restriction enzyme S subunit